MQRHLGEMRAPSPGRAEVRTKGPQGQDAGNRALIDQETQKLQRRRIDPVQVFHDKEHGPLRRKAQQDRQQDLEGLLLLLLGREVQGGVVGGQRERQEGGKERYDLRQGQTVLHQELLEFAQLVLRGLLALEAQGYPLYKVDDWIQGGVLVIGRTLARRQPRLRLSGDMLFQHLHETRFANAGLTAEQHLLFNPLLDLRPTRYQQPDFLLPPHQWGPPGAADRFQATAGHTLIEHAVDRQRLDLAFQGWGA